MGWVRASRSWWKISAFCFLPGSEHFLVSIISATHTKSSWSQVPPTRCMWTRLQSNMQPTQITRHFRRVNNCILFNLGNRRICFFATPATYTEFLQGNSPVYFKRKLYIILSYPRNLCSMLKESFGRYPTISYKKIANFWTIHKETLTKKEKYFLTNYILNTRDFYELPKIHKFVGINIAVETKIWILRNSKRPVTSNLNLQ